MLCITSFVLLSLTSCSQVKNNEIGMRITSKKLIEYLLKTDTASISNLILNADNRNNKYDENVENARGFQKITQNYGIPSEKDMKISKSERGENIISITLMEQIDSSLNVRKAMLFVGFYPDQFLANTEKILDYGFITIPVKQPQRKLIIAPPLN